MSPRNLLRALLPRATRTPAALRSRPGRRRLAAEALEPRAMLATTATFSSDLSPFTKVPVTFRKPDGAVGFSSTALAGQLSWSGMTGDAAAAGVPAAFKSFCIEGLQKVVPGRNTFATTTPAIAAAPLGSGSPIGGERAALLTAFWRQYGPATPAGFSDNTDAAAFQLAVWEITNDARAAGARIVSDLTTGQFSVNTAGRSLPAVLRAQQWLAAFDASATAKNSVVLYALQSPTAQDQVTCVPPPFVDVHVSPGDVPEDGAGRLVYTFTRSVTTSTPLTVNYSVAGSATAGSDYTGLTAGMRTITIPADRATASVSVTPSPDFDIEPDETVVLTVLPGSGYQPGTSSVATGTIVNDDYRVNLILDGLPEETAAEPNELSPGAILPIGGGRVSLIADVPAGQMATLSIFQGADKVQVYRDATGGTPVLEQGRESMLIVGGTAAQPFYVQATAPSLIQGDIQFLLTSGVTSILTETVVASAVRVDLDIDSNNNGSIDPDDGPRGTDDWIENSTSKPLVVNDNDSDLDGVPDYADWSIAGKRFTPLIIRVPASLPLASMQLAVSYAASAPDLIKPDYRLPPDSADRPLRIWTRNAMNREPASVTAGGSFVPAGRFTNLTALGFDESKRTVELYVEGIHTTAGVSRPISIQLFVGDRLTSTDLVCVSVVSNVLVIGIDGTDTRPWLTGANAKRANGLWNSHVRNLIADVEPYAMTIYRYGPVWTGTDSDDIQRDVVARANEIIRDAGGGTKVALVGWSRGAMIALWAANELSGPAAQVAGMHRTVEFVGLYDPVDMATAIPSDEHVRGDNAARIQPGIRRVTIVGPKETPDNNVDYPVGLPSYWTGLMLTPDPVFVRMAQNDRIAALGATTVVDRIEYNASHGAIGGCPGYNVHVVSIPDGRYDYELDVERSVLSDTDIRNGMRAAGLDFVPDRNEDWYGFPATRPVTR